MLRKILMLCPVSVAIILLASCGGAVGVCGDGTKNVTGSGTGTAGNRETSSVCGEAASSGGGGDKSMGGLPEFKVSGPSCDTKGAFTHFLYAGDRLTGTIDTFGLGSDGKVEFLCHSAQMDKAVTAMTVVSNKFLYAYSSPNAKVYAFKADGPMLTATASSPYIVGNKWTLGLSDPLIADPAGRYLYVGYFAGGGINVLSINSTTGALTPVVGSPFTDGFTGVKFAASGNYFYSFQTTKINQFSVDAGVLTPLANPWAGFFVADTPTTGGSAIAMKADPTGKFVYVLYSKSISLMRIDQSTGELQLAADVLPAPLFTNPMPWGFDIDPSGRFVYVANVGSSTVLPGWVDSFSIDQTTGALTAIPGQPFLTGEGDPYHLVVDPDGQHVWVAVGGTNNQTRIFGMSIDPTTGALTPPAVSPTAFTFASDSPIAIAVN